MLEKWNKKNAPLHLKKCKLLWHLSNDLPLTKTSAGGNLQKVENTSWHKMMLLASKNTAKMFPISIVWIYITAADLQDWAKSKCLDKYMKIYHKNAWTCYLTVSTEGLKILMKNLGSVLENQLNTVSYCLRDIIIRDSERYHCHFYLLPCPILRFDKLEYHSAKISLCVHCRRTPLGWESTVYFLHVNRLKQPARVVQPNTLLLVSWLTKSHLT